MEIEDLVYKVCPLEIKKSAAYIGPHSILYIISIVVNSEGPVRIKQPHTGHDYSYDTSTDWFQEADSRVIKRSYKY